MTKHPLRIIASWLILGLTVVATTAQQPIMQAEGIAQAVASMHFANKICGYNASPDKFLAASASMGVNPTDPGFQNLVNQKLALLQQSESAITPELKAEFCANISELMSSMGL